VTHTQGSQKPSGLELFQLGLHVKHHENHSVHFFCKQAQRASSCDAALLEQANELRHFCGVKTARCELISESRVKTLVVRTAQRLA
jgi:hypothetical protein|tara:strand:+ start:327 stop:584 length:258 start_codon:yes stop_codon:yes gene_type:complete